MIKIPYIVIFYAIKSLINMGKIHLGEHVFVGDKEYFINNAVKIKCSTKERVYDCISCGAEPDAEFTRSQIKRKPFAFIGSFNYSYNFFIKHWLDIDISKPHFKIASWKI
jgi:hypothetical protein